MADCCGSYAANITAVSAIDSAARLELPKGSTRSPYIKAAPPPPPGGNGDKGGKGGAYVGTGVSREMQAYFKPQGMVQPDETPQMFNRWGINPQAAPST